MAIDGDTVVVGAYWDDDGGTNSGSAYVFRTTDGGGTYGQVAKLTAADTASFDRFGVSVAIDGSTVVVGAYYKNSYRGAAYVFRTSDGGATYAEVASQLPRRLDVTTSAVQGDRRRPSWLGLPATTRPCGLAFIQRRRRHIR